jgi:hypothetical protein
LIGERIRIGWAATVGTAVGLLLSALLFGPRGIQSWHPGEWKNGVIAGILFYLSTPIREAIIGRPLRGWLRLPEGAGPDPPGPAKSTEGLLNGIVGFCVFGLVDIIGHMFVAGAPAAIDPPRLLLLFLPFVITFSWVWGAGARPPRAAWIGAVMGGAVPVVPLGVLLIADHASPLWTHTPAGPSIPVQIAALVILLFAAAYGVQIRSRAPRRVAAGRALLIAAFGVIVFAFVAPFLEFGYRETPVPLLVFMVLLAALGGLGGVVIDRAGSGRVSPTLACIILGVLLAWALLGFGANPTSAGDLFSIPVALVVLVLLVWGFVLRRGGLRLGINLVILLVGLTALAMLLLPRASHDVFGLMNTVMAAIGWGLGLMLYPPAERAFHAANIPA